MSPGEYRPLPGGARWVVELYGILGPDWQTVKKAWLVRDLQALMDSPSRWIPTDIGCVTDFLGHFCDVPFRGPDV
ncbi:Putative alcohol dehydrogenase [Durusdinium trenchii]|uniref:Alcohol dehydrogenase n=1 Tax=Durusdinium trenchii TaxID=1381693 RepID=A0ABP0PB01_9DINO